MLKPSAKAGCRRAFILWDHPPVNLRCQTAVECDIQGLSHAHSVCRFIQCTRPSSPPLDSQPILSNEPKQWHTHWNDCVSIVPFKFPNGPESQQTKHFIYSLQPFRKTLRRTKNTNGMELIIIADVTHMHSSYENLIRHSFFSKYFSFRRNATVVYLHNYNWFGTISPAKREVAELGWQVCVIHLQPR
jgi:hypothetical protein